MYLNAMSKKYTSMKATPPSTPNRVRSKKRNIYMLFLGGNDPLSFFIRKATNSPYIHSVITFDPRLNIYYASNLKIRFRNYRPYFVNGFVEETLDDYKNKTPYWLYRANVTKKQYQKLTHLIDTFKSNPKMTSYNLIGAAGFVWPRLWNVKTNNHYSFTCSEFVAYLLQTSEISSFKKPLYAVTPGDLAKLKEFHFIEEGKVVDFKRKIRWLKITT